MFRGDWSEHSWRRFFGVSMFTRCAQLTLFPKLECILLYNKFNQFFGSGLVLFMLRFTKVRQILKVREYVLLRLILNKVEYIFFLFSSHFAAGERKLLSGIYFGDGLFGVVVVGVDGERQLDPRRQRKVHHRSLVHRFRNILLVKSKSADVFSSTLPCPLSWQNDPYLDKIFENFSK